MNACTAIEPLISAMIDDELGPAERATVESHLLACPACAHLGDDLRAVRRVVGASFAALVAAAPEPRSTSPSAPPPTTRRRLFAGAFAGALMLGAAVTAMVLWPTKRLDASPRAVLSRAAAAYGAATDVEVIATIELPAIAALVQLFGDEKSKEKPVGQSFRLLAKSPDMLLIQDIPDRTAGWSKERPISGFDGAHSWSFDPATNVLSLRDGGLNLEVSGTSLKVAEDGKRKGDLLELLSWGFVKRIQADEGAFRLKEITGPTDERVGRRVFELVPTPDGAAADEMVWARAEITIDPERDLIEKMAWDLSIGPFSLVKLTAEVAAADRGIDATRFAYQTHARPDAKIVREETAPEKK